VILLYKDSEVSGAEETPRNLIARTMPFKSKAQRRKFAQLLVEGKISYQTFEEWNRETGTKKLPKRVVQKKSTKRASRKTTKTRR
jgi:hypothetical protein